ncbi:hypothetical protein M514_06141, partial [Trichuris suis]
MPHVTMLSIWEDKKPNCLLFATYWCILNNGKDLNASNVLHVNKTPSVRELQSRASGIILLGEQWQRYDITTFVQQFVMKEIRTAEGSPALLTPRMILGICEMN